MWSLWAWCFGAGGRMCLLIQRHVLEWDGKDVVVVMVVVVADLKDILPCGTVALAYFYAPDYVHPMSKLFGVSAAAHPPTSFSARTRPPSSRSNKHRLNSWLHPSHFLISTTTLTSRFHQDGQQKCNLCFSRIFLSILLRMPPPSF